LACLALSLLVVGLAFNLPVSFKSLRPPGYLQGHYGSPTSDTYADREIIWQLPAILSSPVALNGTLKDQLPDNATEEADSIPESPTPEEFLLSGVKVLPVLDFADEMPQISGGLQAYYLHIEYPEEAKRRGIEGRLVLGFIVESTGTTSDVRILESLHPLCDSAAVHALRNTAFIPGEHGGRPRRIRMRLPVRFMLIDPDSTGGHKI